jgi:hypothetical protein
VGRTQGFRRDTRQFYCPDSTPKDIWVRALRPDARDLLRSAKLPEELAGFEKPLPARRVASRLGFNGLRSLFMALQALPDPRRAQGRRYPLGCVLSILTCGVLAGCKGIAECAEFAATLTQTQLEALRSWYDRKAGRYEAPSAVTLWRVASRVDADLFGQTANQWFRDEQRLPEAVALDGKTLRATLHNEDGTSCVVTAASHDGSPFFSISCSPNRPERKSPPPSV